MSTQAQHTPNCEQIRNIVRSSMAPTDPNAPKGILIAEFRDGYGLPHTDEAKANAALFIAAPHLLAALERLTAAMDDYDGNVPASINSPYMQALAAIAKAQGQS